jgi:hypothetical protein
MNMVQATTRKAATIDEFCNDHRISRAFFYKLKKQGRAPRVTAIGSRRVITIEDETEWRRAISAQSTT